MHRLLKNTPYHAYSLCISYEFFSFCIQDCVRQLRVNAIQFPSLIPNIMIKIPMAFIRLITVAPCWDNVCLYDSDKVAVPFVASPLIFWQLTFKRLAAVAHCYISQLGWVKRCIGWVLQAKTDLQKNIIRVCKGASVPGPFTEKEKNPFILPVRA